MVVEKIVLAHINMNLAELSYFFDSSKQNEIGVATLMDFLGKS